MKQKLTFKDLGNILKNNTNSKSYSHQPNKFGKEGEDHINISINSETRLGKVLSLEYIKTFYYPNIGKFGSVSSLWFWVRSENLDDNLRNLTGNKLQDYVKENKAYGVYTPNFKAIIGYATWLKISKYPSLIEELKNLDTSKIVFLSYRTIKSSGIRLSTKFSELLIDIANEITRAVKENSEPNFDFLCDNKDEAGLFYLEGVLKRILTTEKIEELKLNANKGNEDEIEVEESEEDFELNSNDIEEINV